MASRFLLTLALLGLAARVAAGSAEPPPRSASTAAIEIARESQAQWRIGPLTLRTRETRAIRVRAELLAGGRVVARLRVDPATGGFLAEDQRPSSTAAPPDLVRLRAEVERELAHLEIGGWAWPSYHGRAWAVPLRYRERVVGKIKVDVQGRRLLARERHDQEDDD